MTQTIVSTSQTWRPLKIGGGGYVTRLDTHSDGTMVVGTDTMGGYKRTWGDPAWVMLLRSDTMPAGDVKYRYGSGYYEIKMAPSNSSVMYKVNSNKVYKSTNGGNTWVEKPTGWVAVQTDANSLVNTERLFGPYIAIDHVNPDVCYIANGVRVYRTLDGGDNWTAVSGPSDATYQYPGISGIVIDQSSSNSSSPTRKSVVMFHAYGRGWYRSTNGGDSWTLNSTSGPGYPNNPGSSTTVVPYISDAVCNDNGVILACDSNRGAGGSVWRFSGGTWTNIGQTQIAYAAFDPYSANRAIAVSDTGILSECLDVTAGTPSWTGPYNGSSIKDGMDIPWMAFPGEEPMLFCGKTMFSKTIQNRLFLTQGIGVWYVDIAPGFTTVPWKNYTTGIENLVGKQIRKFKNNKHIYPITYDRGFYISGNPEAYADTSRFPLINNSVAANNLLRWGVDVATPDSDPDSNMIAALVIFGGNECRSGITTDRGRTWTQLKLPDIYYELNLEHNSISTVSGSPTVTISVKDANGAPAAPSTKGISVGKYIAFPVATAVGGVSLQGNRYPVATVGATSFTITYGSNASLTVNNSGGNLLWTGDVKSNGFHTENGSDTVKFYPSSASYNSDIRVGDRFFFYGASTIATLNVNGRQTVLSWNGEYITFKPGGTANADVAGGGGADIPYYRTWPYGGSAGEARIVMSTAANWVMYGGGGRLPPTYTTDAGVTWAKGTFPTDIHYTRWGFSGYQHMNLMDSDPDTPGTFYAMTMGASQDCYRSTDGGANWTLRGSIPTPMAGTWHPTLRCVPGHPGHLFYCHGNMGADGNTSTGNAYFSTDGGATWNRMGVATLGGAANDEINGVNYISIGGIKPGSSYPTIWVQAKIDGAWRNVYCTNASPTTTGKWTWNEVEFHPFKWMDWISGMEADPDKWHTCYMSLGGAGYMYTTQDDLTKRTFEITT